MKLKEKIDYAAFFKTVQRCAGEVLLITNEGDKLNLKSTLSQFVFLAAVSGNFHFDNAVLDLENPDDASLLEPFTQPA